MKNIFNDLFKNWSILKKVYVIGIILVVPTILTELVSTDSLVENKREAWLMGILAILLFLMMADFVYALEESNGRSKKSALIRTVATMAVGLLCGGLSFLLI